MWGVYRSNRLCSWISVIGLAMGLACIIVIGKQIRQELTTDLFHSRIDRIYVFTSRASEMDRPNLSGYARTAVLKNEYPAIEEIVSIRSYEGEVEAGNHLFTAGILAVDSTFGKVFGFPMLAGDLSLALSDPGNAVITENMARRIFGKRDPLGESFSYWGFNYKVAGILKNLPVNNSLFFDVLVPTREEYYTRMPASFALMKKGVSSDMLSRNKYEEFRPFRGFYFDRETSKDLIHGLRTGNMSVLWVLGWIGGIVLIISLFNYINIYNVTLLRRNRELGIRKVLGENGGLMYRGFWQENLVLIGSAVFLAWGIVVLSLGIIRRHIGLILEFDWKFDLIFLLTVILLVPLMLAVWPYLKFRKINPCEAIRNVYSGRALSWLRRILLSSQYVMTTLMIIVALYFIQQLDFMLNQDIGLNQKNIIQIQMFKSPRYMIERDDKWKEYRAYFQNFQYASEELQRNPYIQHVCHGEFPLSFWTSTWKNPQSKAGFISCNTLPAAPEFYDLFGMKLKAGRYFDREKDANDVKKVVVNEAALKFFDIQDWQEACLESDSWGRFEIIGVVEDFRYQHLSKRVEPLVIGYFESNENPFLMHITEGKEAEVIQFLQQLQKKVSPGIDFSYSFFDDRIKAQYKEDRYTVKIFSVFTLIAVWVSAMGLFGFSMFDLQQRYREIALRKVNGASRFRVVRELTLQFCLLVGTSFGIACPLAWLIIHKYMEGFSVYAPLSSWLFVVAMLITGGVTLITLFWQSFRAASENPANALKNE